MTDDGGVYHKVSIVKSRPPQKVALTLDIATVRERLVTTGAQTCWTADEAIQRKVRADLKSKLNLTKRKQASGIVQSKPNIRETSAAQQKMAMNSLQVTER